MKKKHLMAAVLAAAALVPHLTHAAGDHTPKHGGVFAAGKEADYELVVAPDAIRLYVTDHGKPLDLSNAAARLTLLSGGAKQDLALVPAGDRLEAKGSFKLGAGAKAVAVVSRNGKTLGTARFTLK